MTRSTPRLFTGSLATESNTFSPIPTSRRAFEEALYIPGSVQTSAGFRLPEGPAAALRERASSEGWDVRYGLCALAQPGGLTTRRAYEGLRDELLADLQAALPVDGVILGLHGAMVASGYPDCEGDILARVRTLAGPDAVIGAVLDPHAHLSEQMVGAADVLIFFKEYPHTDVLERSRELVDIVARTVAGGIRPVMSVFDCRMIGIYHTTREPMAGFVLDMKAAEQREGVLSVSLVHGFPWGDVPDMGTKVLVVTDDDAGEGARLAEAFGRQAFELRGRTGSFGVGLDEALASVMSQERGPVVVADSSDNPGGGAPGDSTCLLRAALDAGVTNAAFGLLWDPLALSFAADAGEGDSVALRIGGKACALSGTPVDLEVKVRKVVPDVVQRFAGLDWHTGQAALVSAGDTDLVLTQRRVQTFLPSVFTDLGVDLAAKRMIAVKSSQHFYSGFAPLAAHVVYLDAPGVLVSNVALLPFRHADRSMWPFDPQRRLE